MARNVVVVAGNCQRDRQRDRHAVSGSVTAMAGIRFRQLVLGIDTAATVGDRHWLSLSAKTDGSGCGRPDRGNPGRKPDFTDGQRGGFLSGADGHLQACMDDHPDHRHGQGGQPDQGCHRL